MKSAKVRGKLPGNPGLRARHPEAIRVAFKARQRVYVGDLLASAPDWLPTVQRMRPQHSWDDVVRVLNLRGQSWTIEKLRRAIHRLVKERMAEPVLIQRSPRRPPEDRLMSLVASIAIADPDLSLRDIAAQRTDARAHGTWRPPVGGLLREITSRSSEKAGTYGAAIEKRGLSGVEDANPVCLASL